MPKRKYEFEDDDNDFEDEYGNEEEEKEEEEEQPKVDKRTQKAPKRKPNGKFIKKKDEDKYQLVYQKEQLGIVNTEDETVEDATSNFAVLQQLVKIQNDLDKIKKAVL